MKLADIFRHDLDREIKEVIKVDDADVHDVAEEIGEYVVTEHIHDYFAEVLDRYQESILKPTDSVNAWVSGFFGSGKSSFAKILGYILADTDLGGISASGMFTQKLAKPQIRALLNTIHKQAPTLAVFVDLSSSRNVAREGESVVLPLYRELLTRLGYARNITLADLEFTLEGDGDLQTFSDLFKEATGYEWRTRRDKALAVNEASQALHALDSDRYPSADSWARTRPEVEVSANGFAKRSQELLARRAPELKRITFIVDEVGQYVSRSVHRMLDLQGFAQACQKEDGRLWLVATGQETLEDVVGALGDKRVELARVRDRFPITIDLVPSDIEVVVSKRVLLKNEEGAAAVRATYEQHHNQLLTSVMLDSVVRQDDFTGEEFVSVYPLLPYQIQMFIDAVSALRAHGGTGPMVGGANRTLIRLAHQLVKSSMRDSDVGVLATVPMAYDLMNEMIPGPWRAEIDQVGKRHGGDALEVQVTKTVALVSNVRALDMTDQNVAALIHPSADAESRRSEVADALALLVEEETIREGEDGYRLQSPQEKDWEKTRRGRELKTGDFNRMLRDDRLPPMLKGLTASASREFTVQVHYDDEKLIGGDLVLGILEGGADQLERAVRRSRESAHENEVFLVFERSEKSWRVAEEVFRSREMVRDAEHGGVDSGSAELLHEERKRLERGVRQFERSLSEDLLAGELVFRGNGAPLEGRDLRPTLARALAAHVASIYTRLGEFAAPVRRTDASALLRSDDLAGLPDYLGPSGLGLIVVDAEGHKVSESGAVAELVKTVHDRVSYGSEPSGAFLEKHFQKPPYGAELDVIMIVTAAAVRAGLLKVGHGGEWIGTRDARLEQVFSAIPKFRSAVFRTREDLNPEVRTRVAKLLHHDLVGEKPGLSTEELAEFARDRLEVDRERIETAVATLMGLGQPVPEPVDRARQILNRMRLEDDETLVQSLDAGRADLKDGVLAARSLAEVLEGPDLDVLRQAAQVLALPNGDLSEAGREALLLGQEILRTGDYVARFAELRGAIETIEAERTKAWEDARDRLADAVDAARELTAPLLDQVGEGAREEFESALGALESKVEKGSSRDALLARAAQVVRLVEDLRVELGSRQGKQVRRVRASELFSEPVRNEEELDTLLERIRAAGEEALKDDEYFLLL